VILHIQYSTEREGIVQLQTRALLGDVFKKPSALARLAEVIGPLHPNHVRAHHSRFGAPVYHMPLESAGCELDFSGFQRKRQGEGVVVPSTTKTA
jgi:hypothetical protein